jgi:hypothetical protein
MAVNGGRGARTATKPDSEGDGAREQIPSPQIAADTYCVRCANTMTKAELDRCSCPKDGLVDVGYCTGCGHDQDRHRRGRCWTGPLGEPVYRARTQIDCNCQEATR